MEEAGIIISRRVKRASEEAAVFAETWTESRLARLAATRTYSRVRYLSEPPPFIHVLKPTQRDLRATVFAIQDSPTLLIDTPGIIRWIEHRYRRRLVTKHQCGLTGTKIGST